MQSKEFSSFHLLVNLHLVCGGRNFCSPSPSLPDDFKIRFEKETDPPVGIFTGAGVGAPGSATGGAVTAIPTSG